MYRSGTDLLLRRTQSLFVVTNGLVKVSYTDPFGSLQEYFLASGEALRAGFEAKSHSTG